MLRFGRFVGGLHWGSVIPSDAYFNSNIKKKYWGWGGFAKNQVTQVTMFLIIVLNLLNINNAFAQSKINIYKQEYFKQLKYDFDQAYCVIDLVMRESSFNPKAQNGSHFGLPQGKSEYLKTATYKQQITWHIKYIKHRYGTDTFGTANACAAWAHWLKKGWH